MLEVYILTNVIVFNSKVTVSVLTSQVYKKQLERKQFYADSVTLICTVIIVL